MTHGSAGRGGGPRPLPLWPALAFALSATGVAGMVGLAAGVHGAVFWHLVSGCVIAIGCGAGALAGAELVGRRLSVPLGWFLLGITPVAAGLLLAANSREHVTRAHANVLISAAALVLAGLVVGTLRLVVRRGSRAEVGFRAVALAAATVVGLSLVVAWTRAAPGPTMRILLSLIGATLAGYLVTLVAARR